MILHVNVGDSVLLAENIPATTNGEQNIHVGMAHGTIREVRTEGPHTVVAILIESSASMPSMIGVEVTLAFETARAAGAK